MKLALYKYAIIIIIIIIIINFLLYSYWALPDLIYAYWMQLKDSDMNMNNI